MGNAAEILGQGCRVTVFQNAYDFGGSSGLLDKCSQTAEAPTEMGKVLQNGAAICSGNLLWEEGNALETLQK